MTWLAIFRGLISLALTVADYIRDKQLMDAGEAMATAKSLTEMAKRLGIVDQVRAEVAALTDAEIDAELAGDDAA